MANPTQELDFRRFSSDELLANFVAERDLLHEVSPGIPVTTNFMIMRSIREMDYWAWAQEVDVVSNDHYLTAADTDGYAELAFSADLTRGVAGGAPWLLMETSPGAVNWQPRNIARRPGELLRSAVQHVARGADGILFFQWRASRAGAEKYHAGLLPHAGTDTRVWRESVELRRVLDAVAEVEGSVVRSNKVAILFDWHAWWACELDSHPSADVVYLDRAHALHRSLTDAGVGVDFAHPEADLTGYDLIVVPTLYSVTDAAVARLREAVEGGATALVTYFSGIVDESDHVRLGGYPGRVPRPARHPRRGVPAAARARERRRSRTAGPPTCGPSTCTSTEPSRSRRTSTGRRQASRPITRNPLGQGIGLVRRHPAGPRRLRRAGGPAARGRRGRARRRGAGRAWR